MGYFKTVLLDEAIEFIGGLSRRAKRKLYRNISKAEEYKDPRVFKKLRDDIWEFRSWYGFTQTRLLAFWDKSDSKNTIVMATHGFIKKTDKVPGNEIERAINAGNKYFKPKK